MFIFVFSLHVEELGESGSSYGWDHPERLQRQGYSPHRSLYSWREIQGVYLLLNRSTASFSCLSSGQINRCLRPNNDLFPLFNLVFFLLWFPHHHLHFSLVEPSQAAFGSTAQNIVGTCWLGDVQPSVLTASFFCIVPGVETVWTSGFRIESDRAIRSKEKFGTGGVEMWDF